MRCARRGINCVYAAPSALPTHDQPEGGNVDEVNFTTRPDLPPPSPDLRDLASSTEFFTLDLPAWDLSTSPYRFEPFDINLANTPLPAVTLAATTVGTPPRVQDGRDVTPSGQTSSSTPPYKGIPLATPPSTGDAGSVGAQRPLPASLALVQLISQYPALLMKGSFLSPLLHSSLYALYSYVVPDMTLLPHTSMAICCASGLHHSDSSRFSKRAMDAARQRMIGSFVSGAEV